MRISAIAQPQNKIQNFKGKLSIKDWPEELMSLKPAFEEYAQKKAAKIEPDLKIFGWQAKSGKKGVSFRFYWPQRMFQDVMEYSNKTTLPELQDNLDIALLKVTG